MEATLKPTTSINQRTESPPRPILTGIATGQIAGLIMAVVVMAVFTLLGKGPLYPVQVIGSVLFGESALQGFHLGAFIAGLLLHQLGPSLFWGVIFGFIAGRVTLASFRSALFLGLGLGVVSMLGPYLLIPAVMNAMQGTDYWNREVPMFWDWAAHIVFGASFILYPVVQNKMKAA